MNMTHSFIHHWLFPIDHKRIGTMYFIFAMVVGLVGVGLSLLIRLELQNPGIQILSQDAGHLWNALIAGHSAMMPFFVVMMAFMGGFGNWLLPTMIGAKNVAMPPVNIVAFWMVVLAFVLFMLALIFSMPTNHMPAQGGWTIYPPLATEKPSLPWGLYVTVLSCVLLVLSMQLTVINFIVTVVIKRAKGMNLYKLPFFVWSILITSPLMLLMIPMMIGAISMIAADRNVGTSFFDPVGGGDTILLQNLFWFLGDTAIYVMMVPALGIMGHVLLNLSKNPNNLTPFLFAIGGFILLAIGGASGIFLMNQGDDRVLHDTYYIVAQFHYFLALFVVFALIAGVYYWIDKMTGRHYPNWAGIFHFAVFFMGVNLTFFPQYFMEIYGMPRRMPDYPDVYAPWHLLSSVGSYMSVTATLFFFGIIVYTLCAGKKTEDNFWNDHS